MIYFIVIPYTKVVSVFGLVRNSMCVKASIDIPFVLISSISNTFLFSIKCELNTFVVLMAY